MKIAFFVHCFFPKHFYGTEKYTLDLARHYQAWGHEVTVVSAIFQGEASEGSIVTRYEFSGIPVFAIDKNLVPHSRVRETYYQSEMRGVLERVLRELQPDLIHVTHLINHTAALLDAAGELGIPAYATFTDFFGFCLNNKLERVGGGLCRGPSLSRANCVACYLKAWSLEAHANRWVRYARSAPSARICARLAIAARGLPGLRKGPLNGLVEDIVKRPDILMDLYNRHYLSAVSPTKFLADSYRDNGLSIPLHHIWFGIDIDRAKKPERLRDHVPVVGYVGQIAPHKGTDLLIEAFRRLPPRLASLRVYGPSNQSPQYMARLKEIAGDSDVTFRETFPNEQMADVLRGIDLLVVPSRWYENSPLVLLNALATHTPVLVSDVAGMTEFIEPGANGEVFARGNVNELEQKLRKLLEVPDALYSMAATTVFDRPTEVMAQETISMYSRDAVNV